MVIVVTISAPDSAEVGTSFKVSGTVRDDGEFLSGATVSIYVDDNYVTGTTTDVNGYYSRNIIISDIGYYTLKATAVGASATRNIIIYYVPFVSSVTIDAPSSVETGQSFTVSGQVNDQYGNGYGGIYVNLYRNDSLFSGIFADSSGYYSTSTSIGTAGTYTLKAVADSIQATRSITITTPTPPPDEPFTSIMDFVVPDYLPAGSTVSVSVLLKNTGGAAGRLDVNIIGNPSEEDEYTQVGAGSVLSAQPGESVWRNITCFNMPDWNYRLTAENQDSTSKISKTISLGAPPAQQYIVGVAMYDDVTSEYIIGTLIIDGVRYTGEPYKILSQVDEGIHAFNVEPPAGYTFVEWQVYEYGGPLIGTSTARPLSWNIDRHIWIWAEVAAEAPTVAGHIGIVNYWIKGMAGWENLETYPYKAKVGDEIHLAVEWRNDGSSAVVGHVDAQLTSPALYPYRPDAVLNQDRSANPGSGYYVQFAPVTLNESGSWEFFGTLTLNGAEWWIDSKTIIFAVEEAAVGIPTTTTLSAPSKAGVNEKFYISGILYETDSGIPIPSQPINHSYDGKTLGSSTTGVDGDYLKQVSIPESGTWTLKSEFPGTETLQSSRSQAGTVVAATPTTTAVKVIGSIIAGLTLFLYGTN